MPAGFDMCRSKGGQIRTKKMGGGKYMHICFMDGKSYPGEMKMVKSGPTTKGAFMRAAKKST